MAIVVCQEAVLYYSRKNGNFGCFVCSSSCDLRKSSWVIYKYSSLTTLLITTPLEFYFKRQTTSHRLISSALAYYTRRTLRLRCAPHPLPSARGKKLFTSNHSPTKLSRAFSTPVRKPTCPSPSPNPSPHQRILVPSGLQRSAPSPPSRSNLRKSKPSLLNQIEKSRFPLQIPNLIL